MEEINDADAPKETGWKTRAWRLIDGFFPSTCQLCAASTNGLICVDCTADLQKPEQPQCANCAIPLPFACDVSDDKILCPECIIRPPSSTKAVCGLIYSSPTDHIVRQFKDNYGFQWVSTLCKPLIAELVAHYNEDNQALPSLLAPMPLHWRKALKRGYNQSDIIACELSRAFSIPVYRGLKKVRSTATQRELTRRLRMRNLMGSLNCEGGIEGRHLALVDDVMTTGASAECAARVLRAAGAARVDLWILARTPKPAFR